MKYSQKIHTTIRKGHQLTSLDPDAIESKLQIRLPGGSAGQLVDERPRSQVQQAVTGELSGTRLLSTKGTMTMNNGCTNCSFPENHTTGKNY